MSIEQKDPNTGASSFIPTEDEKKQLDLMKKIYSSTVDLDELKNQMKAQELTTQTLQQGANVVNATTPSNLGLEIQGRTLANLLGQTSLDSSKYYVYVPNKGTTKLTVGGNTYENTFRISGQSAVSYKIKQDFRGKVSGSVVDNGNIAKGNAVSNALQTPSGNWDENVQANYDRTSSLDGSLRVSASNPVSGVIAQQLFSFDIIRTLQDKYGDVIWQGKTALADKINIAKQVVTNIQVNWHGYGTSPTGNKATIKRWLGSTVGWFGTTNHVLGTITKVSVSITNNEINLGQGIDTNGFAHFLAHSEPSNGTVSSVINTDYVEIEIETNTNLPLLEDSLYEVDKPTFDKINVDPEYTGQKLLDKFPYVQGVQHLNPVVSTDGVNLIPPFTEWSLNSWNNVISPYKMETITVGSQRNTVFNLAVSPNTTYTFSYKNNPNVRYDIQFRNAIGGSVIRTVSCYDGQPATFTTTADTYILVFNAYNYPTTFTGSVFFEEPMLVLGDKPKPFVPRNQSYLYTNTKLSGFNGVNDVMYKDNGVWKVRRSYANDVTLDGSLNWVFVSDFTGFKRYAVTGYPVNSSHNMNGFITKTDYSILKRFPGTWSSGDLWLQNSADLNLTISDIDSGFAETYTPVSDEIKAYFNGWKVKTVDGVGKPTAWTSVVDGKDAPTQTLAYVKANRAPNYTPYKLTYQLATPKVELVQVEGEILVNGMTQVNVNSGVVVREKVLPKTLPTDSSYWINYEVVNGGLETTKLSNRVSSIISVLKNGIIDLNWVIYRNTSFYGGIGARIDKSLFDPKAEYTVTYTVLDKHLFTTNAIDVKSTYTQSVRSSLDGLNTRQAQSTTDISILQGITVDILARLKANNL